MEQENQKNYNNEKSQNRYSDFYINMHKHTLNPTDTNYNKFLLDTTEDFVKYKLGGMTKTQLRNVFELIKNCNSADEMKMTKPKLLYTAGRLNGEGKKFLLELSKLVSKVSKEEEVNLVKKFMETVLAYHKYHAKN